MDLGEVEAVVEGDGRAGDGVAEGPDGRQPARAVGGDGEPAQPVREVRDERGGGSGRGGGRSRGCAERAAAAEERGDELELVEAEEVEQAALERRACGSSGWGWGLDSGGRGSGWGVRGGTRCIAKGVVGELD